MSLLSFFISSMVVILIPGSGVIYTISVGISSGKKASIFAALGCTAGIVPHIVISNALSTFILSANTRIFTAVKLAGALYLLYLGARMLFSKADIKIEQSNKESSVYLIMRRGVIINILNPKLTIFFLSFLPQYINTSNGSYFSQSLILGITFMALTLIVFIGYGILAGSTKRFIAQSPKAFVSIQKCLGLILVVFAIQLGISS